MSDEEWACLEPFVIERGTRSDRHPRNHRLVLDGIFWIARTGVAWRALHDILVNGHRFIANTSAGRYPVCGSCWPKPLLTMAAATQIC
jgi:transposase